MSGFKNLSETKYEEVDLHLCSAKSYGPKKNICECGKRLNPTNSFLQVGVSEDEYSGSTVYHCYKCGPADIGKIPVGDGAAWHCWTGSHMLDGMLTVLGGVSCYDDYQFIRRKRWRREECKFHSGSDSWDKCEWCKLQKEPKHWCLVDTEADTYCDGHIIVGATPYGWKLGSVAAVTDLRWNFIKKDGVYATNDEEYKAVCAKEKRYMRELESLVDSTIRSSEELFKDDQKSFNKVGWTVMKAVQRKLLEWFPDRKFKIRRMKKD